MYKNPTRLVGLAPPPSPEEAYNEFLDFYEDVYMELSKYGRIEGLHVVDNVGDHMIGHVYVKYFNEEEAADALSELHGRYYDGTIILAEYSPVTDFREARCRDFDEETCSRAGFCNFLHVKPVPPPLVRSLQEGADEMRRQKEEKRMLDEEEERRKHKKRKREKKEKKSKRSRRDSSSDENDQDDRD